MRTANTTLNSKTFRGLEHAGGAENVMSIQGTVNKTMILLVILLISMLHL